MPACWEGLHLTTRPGLCFGLLLSGGSAGGWQRSRAGETDMFCSCFDSFSWKRALGKPLWNIAIAARLPWPSSVRRQGSRGHNRGEWGRVGLGVIQNLWPLKGLPISLQQKRQRCPVEYIGHAWMYLCLPIFRAGPLGYQSNF